MNHCLSSLVATAFSLTFLTAITTAGNLVLRQDATSQAIMVFRDGLAEPILTQNAGADFRPYIHPIVAPDGTGVLTEFSPRHHKHQTGLYWGFTKLNGRDYFHNPSNGYWRRLSSQPVIAQGSGSALEHGVRVAR